MHTLLESPIGTLTLVASPNTMLLQGVYMEEHRHRPEFSTFGEHVTGSRERTIFGQTIDQLGEYFAGERQTFSIYTQPAESATPFQRNVWNELARIPYGETITYGTLAERIGNPKAVRAVGLANGRNPLSIIVPCHRVVGAKGSLTGYGGGVDRKRFLLEHEATHTASET